MMLLCDQISNEQVSNLDLNIFIQNFAEIFEVKAEAYKDL